MCHKSRPLSYLDINARERWLWINSALLRNKKFSGTLSCQLRSLRRGCANCAIVPEPCSLSTTWELVSGKIKVKHAGANFAKSLLGNCFNDHLNKRLGMSGSWHALHGVEADLHCYSKVTICYLYEKSAPNHPGKPLHPAPLLGNAHMETTHFKKVASLTWPKCKAT